MKHLTLLPSIVHRPLSLPFLEWSGKEINSFHNMPCAAPSIPSHSVQLSWWLEHGILNENISNWQQKVTICVDKDAEAIPGLEADADDAVHACGLQLPDESHLRRTALSTLQQ